MRGPEEWPSRSSNVADKIRLTGPAATIYLVFDYRFTTTCFPLLDHSPIF